jgi:CPA2 family monovalent cation:H+ antiporter-2
MEFGLLKDIVIIFALSIIVNLFFNKLKIPTVVGYLLTGILAGPYLLSLVDGKHEIELLAEIGVILLLFTIGMEFSLKHLLKIRKIVFLGGLMQVSITGIVFYVCSIFYGLDVKSGIFIGFITALSSSALVLKLLQERSELTSNYGRTTLGILIFQDILLVPLLLVVNLMGAENVDITWEVLVLSFKAICIIAFVYVGNRWLFPKLLHLIAMTKNQELFMMSIFFFCLGIALLTYKLGMSLAFGAFLAGLMISGSHYSHNAFSHLVPFKDIFTSFFFVSIGMLLNLDFVIENYGLVLLTVVMVLGVKTVIAGATGFVLGHTFRGTVMVGLALSQVGEFSFILAKVGLDNGIMSSYFYQLFLAVAVITMAITPFSMRISQPLANHLLKLPLPKFWVEGLFPLQEIEIPDFKEHIVIIGKDRSAIKLSKMASLNKLKHVSIIFDPLVAKEQMDKGELVVYGDAINEPILQKAHVETAELVIVSVGDLVASMGIIEKIKQLNVSAYVIARTKYIKNVELLYRLGADQVFPEKLEVAIDLFNRVLVKKLYTQRRINRILNKTRSLNLGEFSDKDIINQPTLFDDLPTINISAITVESKCPSDGCSIGDIHSSSKLRITILAIKRGPEVIEHPNEKTIIEPDDIVYVLGNPEQINLAYELFNKVE